MRPPAQIRLALRDCLASVREPVTWRSMVPQVAQRIGGDAPIVFTPAEQRLVRWTMNHMAASGELERAGRVPVPGVNRGMTAFVPARAARSPATASAGAGAAGLDASMRSWATFV